jgi:two-component system cell cycle response regulator
MTKQVMVDPESGLHTEEYLKQQGRQALAHWRSGMAAKSASSWWRSTASTALVGKLGRPVGDQLIKQFRAVLSKRVRLEDTVSQTGPAQFTVVCPGIGLEDAAPLPTAWTRPSATPPSATAASGSRSA